MALRFFAGVLVLLAVAITAMSVASVESPNLRASSSRAAAIGAGDWPRRDASAPLDISRTGPGPADFGVLKSCRVLSLGKDREHGTEALMLVTTDPELLPGEAPESVFSGSVVVDGQPSDFKLKLVGQNLLFAQVMPATNRPVGTLLYLGSINVNSAEETKLLQAACDRGWNVLACSIGIDYMSPEKVVVLDEGSTRLARRIDNHLADRAYAMEALLAYVATHRPELLVGPRVIVGMSAGAIALPTVVARIGAVDAAVLIGGGENVAEIIAESSLFSQHIQLVDVRVKQGADGNKQVDFPPCANPRKRAEFVDAVRRKSKIDPSRAAAALAGIPVLMIHAKYDDIVPAAAGQSMYESLGRPERWQYHTGHIGLTLLIPWKINYLLDWLDVQTVEVAKSAKVAKVTNSFFGHLGGQTDKSF